MKRFLIAIVTLAIVSAAIIIGITLFLSKNDLQGCGDIPDAARQQCAAADAIVAVSGGDTSARTAEAVQLYKNNWAHKLVFSGAAADKTGPSNARAMKRQAIVAGVPANDILIEETSETTAENASQTVRLLKQKQISSVILVTSAYHSRRVSIEFTKAAPNILTRSHPVATDNQWSNMWWTTVIGWQLALQELVKIMGVAAE